MQIKYAISALFDLDVGATVKACTPPTKEPLFDGSFAQLLVPDGAHQHLEDWTFFSLWSNDGHLEYVPKSEKSQQYYVCNFLKSVYSSDIKRGAKIVTLTVITPDPSYSCLKSLIAVLLARELESKPNDKFDPQALTDKLFNTIKSIDDSLVPKYSYYEKRVLDTQIATLGEFSIFGNRDKSTSPASVGSQPVPQLGPLSISPFRTDTPLAESHDYSSALSTPRIGVQSSDDSAEEYVPIDIDHLEEGGSDADSSSDSSDSKETVTSERLTSSVVETKGIADKHFERLVVEIEGLDHPILVPVPTFSDVYNSGAFSVTRALRSLTSRYKISGKDKTLLPFGNQTPALTLLWLSVMSGQRVLIYQDPSTTSCNRLCELVLACGYLSSAQGLVNTNRRTFPLIDLSMAEELQEFATKEGGFLAGTTNEAFILHPEWWDVLIRPDTKTITISSTKPVSLASRLPFPRTRKAVNRIKMETRREDVEFYRQVVKLAKEWYNETKLRLLCNRQFQLLIRLAADEKSTSFPNQMVADKIYAPAVAAWHSHKSSKEYYGHLKTELTYETLVKDLLLRPFDVTAIYSEIEKRTGSKDDIARFLLVPDSTYYLSLGLFHRDPEVRKSAARTLKVLKNNTLGEVFLAKLPPIHRSGLKLAV